MSLGAALAAALSSVFAENPPPRIGVAVSGGGDSLALMLHLADWAAGQGTEVHVATVDHGLRPESAAEARMVARRAAEAALPHETLHWIGGISGNLQAAARAARYRLLTDWAAARGITHVCLGHTADDQAETVLLNLARGSGVDGLAAMPVQRQSGGITWLRPLLDCRRAALRDDLRIRGMDWAEDPGNADTRYDRVRARLTLADPPLPGLTVPRLSATARRMAAAHAVLSHVAAEAANRLARVEGGEILFEAEGFLALPDDTRWRLLATALSVVSGRDHRPRFAALERAEALLRADRPATLHGCLCAPWRDCLRIGREAAALGGIETVPPGVWDGRWRITGPARDRDGQAVTVRALGPGGVTQLSLRTADTGQPRATMAATPAIWAGETVLAAPAVSGAGRWSATPLLNLRAFIERLKSD